MTGTLFSFRALAVCWAGLLAVLGSGAVALQLTGPPSPFVVAAAVPTMMEMPLVAAEAALPQPSVMAPAPPGPVPMPFENRSLIALLPPPSVHPALHPAPPLPVPPLPPARRVAHATVRRVVPAYAAVPAPPYDPVDVAQSVPYLPLYARSRAYSYAGPRTYYGW